MPKLIMLDIKMPKVGGVEVLRKLRADKRFADIPVVMLTSSDEPIDVDLCRKLGANGYVKKPVDFVEFVDAIRQVAHYWLTCQKNRGAMPKCLFALAEHR